MIARPIFDSITPSLEFGGTTKDDVSHRYLWGSEFDHLFADEQVAPPPSNQAETGATTPR